MNVVNMTNNHISTLQLSQQSVYLFIYADGAVNSQIQSQINYVNVFAVFGFNIDNQIVLDCQVNISINFQVVKAALLCLQCNIMINQCSLSFIASGQYLSAVIISTHQTLILQNSTVEYRFDSSQSSGIVNQLNSTPKIFQILNVRLIGFDYINESMNGYIISHMNAFTQIYVTNFIVCTSTLKSIAVKNAQYIQVGSEITKCIGICKIGQKVTYGLCLDSLILGELIMSNLTQYCVYPFQYDSQQCVCVEGFYLNNTFCFNLINQLTMLDVSLMSNYTTMDTQLNFNTTNIENMLINNSIQTINNINTNLSILDNRLNTNISIFNTIFYALSTKQDQNNIDLNNNLFDNASYIETQLINNHSSNDLSWQTQINNLNTAFQNSKNNIEQQLTGNFTKLMVNLNQNTTTLDQRIKNNFTTLTNSQNILDTKVTTNQNNLNNANSQMQSYIETQLINNNTAQISSLNTLLTGLRTDLTTINGTQNGQVNGMRTDLNGMNDNITQLISTQTNNVNNAQARINSVVNDITSLKGVDNSIQSQINAINAKGVQSVSFQYRSLPVGYYGATVSVLYVCVDTDCREIST
ncbi:Growth_factor receptor cysteine-rich domain superfamily [Hexamita inflata]|uniref:Growth_factor receptor cysteine-rich domain superfamily n=2 Tax=Hexamita inflata TaxID=28002 RepID=A0ABP1HW49_9EUKA